MRRRVRYPPDRNVYHKCAEPGCMFYGTDKQADGNYYCEPHRMRYLYRSGQKEARGGFII